MRAMPPSDRLPFNARMVRAVCRTRGWRFLDLDGGEGYLFAVEADGRRVHCGAGAICAYPGNPATAYTIARDKAFTTALLGEAGLPHVPTSLYFLETARAHLRAPGRERADLEQWGSTACYPVFAKPNRGAHGDFAELIRDQGALHDYLDRVARFHDQIVVQPFVDAPEFRVLVVAGVARFQYGKAPGGLAGDGRSSWQRLFERLNGRLANDALSPVTAADFAACLEAAGVRAADRSTPGTRLPLGGRGNIAAGGQVDGFTTTVSPPLADLAVAATAALGLQVAGVDLFAPAGGVPVVLEVNANPGFQSLETLGEVELAQALWADILTRALEARR
ncbi:hypothetical protein [Maricaulis sp.]|uniref:ATP-grasp domain-containing protein n=1 Tax=Maricaulis sp. TaxID=1486257 RepID=UPI002B274AC1|nr:hypothetical protein [Maricaulis sp.]